MSVHLADMRQRLYESEEKSRIEISWLREKTEEHIKEAEKSISEKLYNRYDFTVGSHGDQIVELREKRKKDVEQWSFLVERANRSVETNEMRMGEYMKMFDKNQTTLQQMLESIAIINLVLQQDEIEKQSLALFGSNSGPSIGGQSSSTNISGEAHVSPDISDEDIQPQVPIKIDKKCFTCALGSN